MYTVIYDFIGDEPYDRYNGISICGLTHEGALEVKAQLQKDAYAVNIQIISEEN